MEVRMHPRVFITRRAAAAALIAAPAVLLHARGQQRLAPTPSQTEGPFYPVDMPKDSDADLLRNGSLQYTRGTPVTLAGSVTDVQGKPLRGGAVEIWQCDGEGHYHHPGDGGRADPAFQGFGRVVLDGEGRYRFRTIRPVAYSGRAPHIHLKVKLANRELLTTQVYVQGDRDNERDGLWRRLSAAQRAAVTVPFTAADGGLHASFPIVVEA
jgi:protocatechuate 3,4-dioxygenase beta subunit